jgi:hypothetical protein
MPASIEALTRPDKNDVGLRFIVPIHVCGVLHADNNSVAKSSGENHIRAIYGHRVSIPDGTHLDNLAFDKFHAIGWRKDTDVGHPVVVVDRKSLSSRFNLHTQTCFEG